LSAIARYDPSISQCVAPRRYARFDVNLRQSFYNAEVLSESAKLADIMKVNNEELPIMAKLLQIPFIYDESRAARWLRDTFS